MPHKSVLSPAPVALQDLTYYSTRITQPVIRAVLGPWFIGATVQFFLAGFACATFGRYLATPNYRCDPRAHQFILWTVMSLLALAVMLSTGLVLFHGVSQKRGSHQLLAVPVADSLQSTLGGAAAALVQGFLLVRAARESMFDDWIERSGTRLVVDPRLEHQLLRDHRRRRAAFLTVGSALIGCVSRR